MKKIIAVDADDVLVDCNTSLQQFHNLHYGSNYQYKDIFNFDLTQVWQVSAQEVKKRVFEFYASDYFANLSVVEGAIEAVAKLSQKYTLIVITSRPESVEHITQASLEKYFPGKFSAIYHINHFSKTKRRKKSEICKLIGAKIMIDDSLNNVYDCARAGIKTVILRRPWNMSISDEELKHKQIIPASSWAEIVNLLT